MKGANKMSSNEILGLIGGLAMAGIGVHFLYWLDKRHKKLMKELEEPNN